MQVRHGIFVRTFRFLFFCASSFLLFQFVSLYLSWPKQATLGALSLLLTVLLHRSSRSRVITLSLMLISMAATLRYGWWRVHMVYDFFTNESNHRIGMDSVLMLVLLSAEFYTTFIMVLGYMQTSFPLSRKPVPLPSDEDSWPHVDILIPTYNEALSLVRYTALAAINIDYPPEKLHVYILDDGSRPSFRAFAEEAGIGYVVRKRHDHAKAGNINHALARMNSPFVAIFDCDHVPTRSFLQFTLGWFLVEDRLAMLQTPHHFYSPDPFERNLQQYKSIPNEGGLFYGIIQDGNDFWNATFFCGSCAVIRRTALDEVGGIATETVTEDAHTSLRMQKHGWNTAYINVAQAAGLATETLAAHVGQRVRWARGMIQILRTDNPLFGGNLKITQRLCYFNAMLHFMYAVPRLIFLSAPLVYMLFGHTIIPGYWVAILAYALPHLAISSLTNSRIQGRHRHSFWNEIYETVLAPYILLPTLLALFNPKLGKFNVTDKGTTLAETQFDRSIAAPTSWLLALNLLGVLVAPYRLLVLDPTHPGTVISNLVWVLFNMIILGVAAAVAHEQKQRRSSVRIMARIPIVVRFPNGATATGMTRDMSVGGASIELAANDLSYISGEEVQLAFPAQTGDAEITATIVAQIDDEIRLQFQLATIAEQETLTRALYSRADSWLTDQARLEEDRPLISFARIVRLSFTGFRQVLLGLLPRKRSLSPPAPKVQNPKKSSPHPSPNSKTRNRKRAAVVSTSLLLALLSSATSVAQTLPGAGTTTLPAVPAATPTAITTRITLKDMGVEQTADMRGLHAYSSVHFALSHTQLPRSATLNLTYHFDRRLAQPSGGVPATIQVRLNNTALTIIPAPSTPQLRGQFDFVSVAIPSDLLIRDNELTFEFSANGAQLPPLSAGTSLASIGATSNLTILSDPLPFQRDLSLLPLPIYDSALQTTTTVPFVFLTQPSLKTLQAAGIVASWFGVLSSSKPVRFSVWVGDIPPGNVVLFTENPAGLPASLATPTSGGSLSIKTNPSDPNGEALVLAALDGNQLLNVARELSLLKGASELAAGETADKQGDTRAVDRFLMPAERLPDDAPRWLPTDRLVSLVAYSSQTNSGAEMQGDGSRPLPLYFRVPPDLYYGETQNLRLHLSYRYNAVPLAPGSALRVFANGMLIHEAPLPAASELPLGAFGNTALGGEIVLRNATASNDRTREVLLPVVNLRPFANTLLFHFDFAPRRHGDSANAAMHLNGTILRNSSLDLRGLDHWARMPNLELFSNAGFPFTQYADLSQTVVVLSARPSIAEITLFLHMMSHCGRQTGYPALRLQVAGPNDTVQPDRDYLVLGSFQNQSTFAQLQSLLPVAFDNGSLTVQQKPDTLTRIGRQLRGWLHLPAQLFPDTAPLTSADAIPTALPPALIEGTESPFTPGRSLVVVALRDDTAEPAFTDAFFDRSQSSDIAGPVSLLTSDADAASHFLSYTVDTPGYHIGTISPYARMRIWLAENFAVLLLIVAVLSLILARWIREYLEDRAAARLAHGVAV